MTTSIGDPVFSPVSGQADNRGIKNGLEPHMSCMLVVIHRAEMMQQIMCVCSLSLFAAKRLDQVWQNCRPALEQIDMQGLKMRPLAIFSCLKAATTIRPGSSGLHVLWQILILAGKAKVCGKTTETHYQIQQ